ncbi:carboxylic acid reductase [Kitasatospora brasiliensis]|uniref:carboxylic acid reductase n=1 Tax=Kitasatospora brasiliensis TaxID=3058040 RepID=UPI00292DA089|nr:carboxylic acid reductase [Kitasatospora sp. K002]
MTPAPAGSGQSEAVRAALADPATGPAEIMATVMAAYGDRPALGERARDRATGRLLPSFDTISYRELWTRVRALAGAWAHEPGYRLAAGDRVCTLGFSSTDYAVLELACVHLGLVSVPLHASAPLAQLAPIVAETEPLVLATSCERLDTAVAAVLGQPSVRRLVVFDYHPELPDHREAFAAAERQLAATSTVLDPLGEAVGRGALLPPPPLHVPAPGEDPLALLLYTSGSTGAPKGAMYPQRLARNAWWGFVYGPADIPSVVVHYMPQSHQAGRMSVLGTLARGGLGCFTARSDLSCLFEDIGLVRPTELTMVPRVADMLFQQYRIELGRWGGEPGDADTAVKKHLRETFLGGRVAKAFCGTAPLSAEVAEFVESCLGLHLYTGYGSTEAGGVLLDTVVQRPPVLDYKLADVPESGCYRTDRPYPRGELLLRTSAAIPGYYRRPELTASVFDEDGYYRTGDIMAEVAPDRLVYVGRTKDVLKLSQGEFVTVSRLEGVFLGSPLVRQVFVYGNSERSHLLAVVVPTPDALARCDGEPEALRRLVDGELRRTARENGLHPYEVPRDVLIETEPFSPANGLLSDSHKPLRPKLVERYGPALERRYAELAEEQADQLRELRSAGADRPVRETVDRAVRAVLGRVDTGADGGARFTDLGGDSLSALTFTSLLKEVLDVEVPVGVVIAPATDLAGVAAYIEARRAATATRPTAASVHGVGATELRARDLTLDRFIDAPALAAGPALPPRTVLLTGANGFLGRFLCLEWLRRLGPSGGRLICLVRGATPAEAAERLARSFGSDTELASFYRELSDGTLTVLAGDLAEPRLGLDRAVWHGLAESVDLVVHPAALVNHVLPYGELFGPNVAGTAELVRLALAERLKPVSYLSTVAVRGAADPAAMDEDADIRETLPRRRLGTGYADGYAAAKWAGEVLLREAHERYGLPVTTFRSGMILAHSRYPGQLNVPDVLTRLLLSLVATGLAPRSFHRGGAPAHYDGLPVDFLAEAVTALGTAAPGDYRTFNASNPHEDGASLDTFVDWLIEAGHPIRRIDDYQDWFGRFTTAVRALPERQRAHSVLPLLHAFERPAEGRPAPAPRFRAAVRAAGLGPDRDVPRLAPALVAKYVADLRGLGLL